MTFKAFDYFQSHTDTIHVRSSIFNTAFSQTYVLFFCTFLYNYVQMVKRKVNNSKSKRNRDDICGNG